MKLMRMTLVTALLAGAIGLAGTAARAVSPPPMIAQVDSSGGLVPPGTVNAQGVRIFADGSVVAYRDQKFSTVVQLTPHALAKLQAIFKAVQPGTLVDSKPDEPLCMDAPVLEYRIFPLNAQGAPGITPLVIDRFDGCHEFYLQAGEAITAKYTLEDLRNLAAYVAF